MTELETPKTGVYNRSADITNIRGANSAFVIEEHYIYEVGKVCYH